MSYDRYSTGTPPWSQGYPSQPLDDAGSSLNSSFEYTYGAAPWMYTQMAGWQGMYNAGLICPGFLVRVL